MPKYYKNSREFGKKLWSKLSSKIIENSLFPWKLVSYHWYVNYVNHTVIYTTRNPFISVFIWLWIQPQKLCSWDKFSLLKHRGTSRYPAGHLEKLTLQPTLNFQHFEIIDFFVSFKTILDKTSIKSFENSHNFFGFVIFTAQIV